MTPEERAKALIPEIKNKLTITLSGIAWAALDQMKRGAVWDGDLISKNGRGELVKAGLAARDNGMNYLTDAGISLAARMSGDDWHKRGERLL